MFVCLVCAAVITVVVLMLFVRGHSVCVLCYERLHCQHPLPRLHCSWLHLCWKIKIGNYVRVLLIIKRRYKIYNSLFHLFKSSVDEWHKFIYEHSCLAVLKGDSTYLTACQIFRHLYLHSLDKKCYWKTTNQHEKTSPRDILNFRHIRSAGENNKTKCLNILSAERSKWFISRAVLIKFSKHVLNTATVEQQQNQYKNRGINGGCVSEMAIA